MTIEGGTCQVGLTVMYHLRRHDRRRHGRLAGDDPGHPDLSPVVEDAQRKVGQVDDHIILAQVVRHPAPALKIGKDCVDRPVGRTAVEAFAQLRHAAVLGADRHWREQGTAPIAGDIGL
jgi:hypothetical protein